MDNDKFKNTISNLTTPRKITSYTTAILLLVIIGVFQFVSLGCDVSKLLEPNFYLTLAYRCLLVFMAYYIANNLVYDKCINSEEIKNAFYKFKELNKLKDSNFPEFLELYNNKLKKEAFKDKINNEIIKLENRLVRIKNKKKIQKITYKISEKKKLLTDEYIDANIDFIKVKYYHVLESDFVSTELLENTETHKTRTDYNTVLFKSIVKKVLPYIMTSLVLGMTITNSLNKPTNEVIINLMSDLVIICMRSIQGLYDAQKIIDSAYLIPYSNKVEILKEYLNWNSNNPASKASKILNYIEQEEKHD